VVKKKRNGNNNDVAKKRPRKTSQFKKKGNQTEMGPGAGITEERDGGKGRKDSMGGNSLMSLQRRKRGGQRQRRLRTPPDPNGGGGTFVLLLKVWGTGGDWTSHPITPNRGSTGGKG